MTTTCSCGQPLFRELGDSVVVTMAGLSVQFRRHTDHVICPSCLVSYRVEELRQAGVPA
jgi:uncharacterized Zn finger protein (UPF0148 family)